MQQFLALALEARGAVWHHTFALGSTNFSAQVGLAGLAEFAFLAFGSAESYQLRDLTNTDQILLECNNIVTGLDRGDALTNRLDDTGAFVSKDDREGTLRILA